MSEREVRTGLLLGQFLRKWFRRDTPTLDFAAQATRCAFAGIWRRRRRSARKAWRASPPTLRPTW